MKTFSSLAYADGCDPPRLEGGKNSSPPDPANPTGLEEKDEKLRAYVRLKLSLAAQVRALRETLKARGSENRVARCDALMVKLAEDRFTLAVLGQLKRGKSSLMNALIGRDLLPVGVLPLTSAVTVLRFGPRERLLLRRANWATLQEVPVAQLASFVTENGNPGNCEQVQAAYLELPLPFLRRGMEVVDTPGVGSAIPANTATTYEFLPECDAALFVTSAEAPLTGAELKFLRDVRQHAAKLFFIVNKIDLLAPAERTEVIDFTARTICAQTGVNEVEIFPVSARLGLAGNQQADEAQLAESGVRELEAALAIFLTDEKAAVFLASVVEKADGLLSDESVEEELRLSASRFADAVLSERRQTLQHRLQQHAAEREVILQRVRTDFLADVQSRVSADPDGFWAARKRRLSRQIERLLRRTDWMTAGRMMRRASRALGRSALRAAWRGAEAKLDPRALAPAVRSSTAWNALQSNVARILPMAAEIFGIDEKGGGDADAIPAFPPRRDGALLAPSLPSGFEASPALAWLPVWCARKSLGASLRKRSEAWLDTCRETLDAFAIAKAGELFDVWSDKVRRSAIAVEARVQGLIDDSPSIKTDATLSTIRRQLARLRGAIAALNADGAPVWDEAESDTHPELPAKSADVEARPVADFGQDLRTRGCALCDHLGKVALTFFSSWQYALYTSQRAQSDFAAELGFCPLHQWQLEAVSSPVGTSVGQANLVERVARSLADAARKPTARKILRSLTPEARSCRVCELQTNAAHDYLAGLLAFVETAHGRKAYGKSQGLCLRHLHQLIATAHDENLIEFLLTHAARCFEETAEDMQSYGMKTEALRRQLENTDENDAWWRALTHLVGSRRGASSISCDGEI